MTSTKTVTAQLDALSSTIRCFLVGILGEVTVWMLGVEVIQDAYKIRGFLGRPPFLAARTGPDRGGCR